ncbi:hypothetical protein ASPZODRAFT_154691 [Penicilliopsis zonata CBS 506.65]|uniref:Uncharacterized protein n=1 Tax=Penicilliopsis zonata CBS 506.65 TaxID=1073090 RepID=A0A1L9S7U5_9EURO|nr:hypothetical protein ASPZODRAFT_154691 [Penicilliopsis zonata CBS 506.65]OJJ43217.1 hypothetical protein ASPZODRAFT_154691 [Penicilliopsis zonata CBS 506.65]
MSGRQVSHGRGGAGNIFSKESNGSSAKDLVTPTIKQDIYTTGRGGSGNMVVNDPQHPELARESQDVELPPQRQEQGRHFLGRGGVANAYIPPPGAEEKFRQQEEQELQRVRTASRDRLKELERSHDQRKQSPAS